MKVTQLDMRGMEKKNVSLWDKLKPALLSHRSFKLLVSGKLDKLLDAAPSPSIDDGKEDTILELTDARTYSKPSTHLGWKIKLDVGYNTKKGILCQDLLSCQQLHIPPRKDHYPCHLWIGMHLFNMGRPTVTSFSSHMTKQTLHSWWNTQWQLRKLQIHKAIKLDFLPHATGTWSNSRVLTNWQLKVQKSWTKVPQMAT